MTMPAATNDNEKKKRSEKRRLSAPIPIRFSPEDKDLVTARAKERNLSVGDYLRSLATGKKPLRIVQVAKADREAVLLLKAEMGKIGSNINQVARKVNRADAVQREQLDTLIKLLIQCSQKTDEFINLLKNDS